MITGGIELVGVSTVLGGRAVLDEVSFEAPANRVTILLGPSGVGKTTCLRHVTGLLPPGSGAVLIEGRPRSRLSQAQLLDLQRRFGVVFQGGGLHGSALFESMTVLENVGFQLRVQSDPRLAANQLRSRPDPLDPESTRKAMGALAELGMDAHADSLPETLSAGMRRRVALARALVADPDFLIVDGLDAGLDGVRLMRICELLAERHERSGGTWLIATHDMEVARKLADHVVVLWGGQVAEQGPPDEVFDSAVPAVRQLIRGDREGPLGLRTERSSRPEASRSPDRSGRQLPDVSVRAILLVALAAAIAAAITLTLFVEGYQLF